MQSKTNHSETARGRKKKETEMKYATKERDSEKLIETEREKDYA